MTTNFYSKYRSELTKLELEIVKAIKDFIHKKEIDWSLYPTFDFQKANTNWNLSCDSFIFYHHPQIVMIVKQYTTKTKLIKLKLCP